MRKAEFFKRHAKLLSVFGVLLLGSSAVLVLVQEARAVSVGFVSPPTTVSGGGAFTVDVTIPGGQRIPITGIDAVLEQQRSGRTDKAGALQIARVTCPMNAVPGANCPGTLSFGAGNGLTAVISGITFVGAFRTDGTALTSGYFGYGALTGTQTGYGYDTISPAFNLGLGYGYGYNTGQVGAYNAGTGDGYGYGANQMVLRYSIQVAGSSLSAGTYYLTAIVQTGSGIIGTLSSPFTEFAVSGGGGGGGGSGGGGGGGSGVTLTPSVSGSTATVSVTAPSGTVVNVPLSGLNSALGTLTLTLANTLTNAQISVTTSNTPTEGAIAIPTGFNSFLYLSINVPAGSVSGGALTFTLTNAQLGTHTPQQVSMLHFTNGAWVAVPTTVGTTGPSGASFTATLPSFSPFAIVFDTAPPTVGNLRPPDGSSATTRPLIAATLADNRGINTAVTRMTVDGQVVTATVTATEILYTPPVALTIGTHRVEVQTTDLSGFSANRSWSFNAAAAADSTPPTVTPKSPARDGFTNNNRPLIEADYADNLGIDTTKVTATVDGAAAASPAITATGIRFTPSAALSDGRHTVTVTVADTSGNSAFGTWSFTVDTALPVIDRVEPADGGSSNSLRPAIKAVYSDPLSGIATDKVTMSVDGTAVTPSAGAGEVTYTPTSDLSQGRHTVKVDIEDKAGNKASKEWTFTAVAQPQDFTMIIVLVLVLILIVAGAGWWYMKNKKP